MIPINFENNDPISMEEITMENKLKIDLNGYDLTFEINPFSYNDDEDKLYCELKLNFESKAEDLIKLLKLYKKLGDIQKQAWTHKEEEGDGNPIYYLEDEWNLKLEFAGFREEKI